MIEDKKILKVGYSYIIKEMMDLVSSLAADTKGPLIVGFSTASKSIYLDELKAYLNQENAVAFYCDTIDELNSTINDLTTGEFTGTAFIVNTIDIMDSKDRWPDDISDKLALIFNRASAELYRLEAMTEEVTALTSVDTHTQLYHLTKIINAVNAVSKKSSILMVQTDEFGLCEMDSHFGKVDRVACIRDILLAVLSGHKVDAGKTTVRYSTITYVFKSMRYFFDSDAIYCAIVDNIFDELNKIIHKYEVVGEADTVDVVVNINVEVPDGITDET